MEFIPQCELVFDSREEPDLKVWRIALDPPSALLPAAINLLSEDERARHDRFKIDAVKERFAAARASMRTLLGEAMAVPPDSIRFEYGKHGKPRIPPPENPGDIRFNLSHSGDTAVLAVAVGREVGVDVECLRNNVAFRKLAIRFFSPAEADSLNDLEGEELKLHFFRIWTAKETYIKALGKGLRVPLDQFAFRISGDARPILTDTPHDPGQLQKWRFHQFQPGSECIAAVGVERLPGE